MSDDPAEDRTIATEPVPGTVRRERELPVPAEEAWELLRDREGLRRWLADDVDLVVEPGRSGTVRDGDESRSVVVEEVTPGRRVALRWWRDDEAPSDGALVDLTVEPAGEDRSRIVVTEVPLRVVAIPDQVPASWTSPSFGGPSSGPQLLALAHAR